MVRIHVKSFRSKKSAPRQPSLYNRGRHRTSSAGVHQHQHLHCNDCRSESELTARRVHFGFARVPFGRFFVRNHPAQGSRQGCPWRLSLGPLRCDRLRCTRGDLDGNDCRLGCRSRGTTVTSSSGLRQIQDRSTAGTDWKLKPELKAACSAANRDTALGGLSSGFLRPTIIDCLRCAVVSKKNLQFDGRKENPFGGRADRKCCGQGQPQRP